MNKNKTISAWARIAFCAATTVVLCASLISCEDFLEEKPRASMSMQQNFAAPAHARSAVNILYRGGATNFVADGGVYYMQTSAYGGFLSGFFDNEYKGLEVICDYSQKLAITPQNISSSLDKMWDEPFKNINRANTAIKYIPQTPGIAETEARTLVAEAKFFRAYNYFYLVKTFGDVPLHLEPYESLDNLYTARAASAEIYAQIVSDLSEAVAVLPATAFCENNFRISKYTAATVLAHVYLQMSGYPLQAGEYAKAAAAAREVINSGKHRLIAHGETPAESAYNKIRTLDDDPEYIYSLEFETGITVNNGRVQCSLPNEAATWGVYTYSITNSGYRPVKAYMNVYDKEKDLRAQQDQFFSYTIAYEKNGESITFEIPEYASPAAHLWYQESAALETANCDKDFTIYRYAEVLLMAAEAIAQSEGVTTEAVGYLTDVRARAYTGTPRQEIETSLAALSKEAFVQEVWKERMREFVYEFRVYDDIQRTRMYPLTSDTKPGEVQFVNFVGATNPWGQVFKETHLLFPISENEIQRNQSLTQNPGY
ncbi:MAG: RagB/SusD family nutrient uptake outer membrane protein [Tannerellaceae bacterium]|nr:RagB/SusD family nutrient uptake outer membrane protein [Tannerellaceae bacterium]